MIVTGLSLLLPTPVTIPVFGSTEASDESDEDHVPVVIVWVVLSLNVPVSVN